MLPKRIVGAFTRYSWGCTEYVQHCHKDLWRAIILCYDTRFTNVGLASLE